jgi:translation initiation factor 1 (eIF-1/SUI1)
MFTSAVVSIIVRNTIFRKALPSVVSGYDKRTINLNKIVATFEKHIFLSQTDLTRTGVISNSYNEMFEA